MGDIHPLGINAVERQQPRGCYGPCGSFQGKDASFSHHTLTTHSPSAPYLLHKEQSTAWLGFLGQQMLHQDIYEFGPDNPGQPSVMDAGRSDHGGSDVAAAVLLCVHVCLLSCSPFAFGLSY